MKTLTQSLTVLVCCGGVFAACGGDETQPAAVAPVGGAAGAAGSAGTTAVAGGGAGGAAGGTAGMGGAAGGAGGAPGGAGGAAGATAGGGAGGAPEPPYCEAQTPQVLPYKITPAYAPSLWWPGDAVQPGMSDLTNAACPTGTPTFEVVVAGDGGVGDAGADAGDGGSADAGSDDAGSAGDAGTGEIPDLAECFGVTYEKVSASLFAGVSYVPGGMMACLDGVTAVEFWVAGTPGASVNFEGNSQASKLPVIMTGEWQHVSLPINENLNTTGVAAAFSLGFDSAATGTGPITIYVTDINYVGN